MSVYDYQCKKCEEIAEVEHSIKLDALKEFNCPVCESVQKCKRLISTISEPIFKGTGWTVKQTGFGGRGYKGKYKEKIRPVGTPVDAPSDKREADRQFQRNLDTHGLGGIKPTFDFNDKNDPRRPKTAEELVEG